MAKLLEVQTVGLRDAQGRFARMGKGLEGALRNTHRGAGRILVRTLQTYAPEKTGEFKKGFAYLTRELGGTKFSTVIYYKGKKAFLLPILESGAKAHPIEAKHTVLAFYWERGPRGPGMYFYKRVQHPGVQATGFIARAVSDWYPAMEHNFYRQVTRVIQVA